MHVINALNVNDAYRLGMQHLAFNHTKRESRNGAVKVAPTPVTTVYMHPTQRVLFDSQRDANPFFHLFEALWMLAGRDDLAPLEFFVKRFATFSDDGKTLHGAYGHRWREYDISDSSQFIGLDQLDALVQVLRENPADRRAVLSMWDARRDLGARSKDIPCNVVAKFAIIPDVEFGPRLDMTVFNRSNDIVWGCYGANAVHFSVLLEYMAQRLNVAVGRYYQVSCDFHAYETVWDKYWPMAHPIVGETRRHATEGWINPYLSQVLRVVPLVSDANTFDAETRNCIDGIVNGGFASAKCSVWDNEFFALVAQPMFQAYRMYKAGDAPVGAAFLENEMKRQRAVVDWLAAGAEWLKRRKVRQGELAELAPKRCDFSDEGADCVLAEGHEGDHEMSE